MILLAKSNVVKQTATFIINKNEKYTDKSIIYCSYILAKNWCVAELQCGVGKHPFCEKNQYSSAICLFSCFWSCRENYYLSVVTDN